MLQESKISLPNDLGDFQTPLELAEIIAARLTGRGFNWGRVLEPTCGEGNFFRALSPHVSNLCQMQGIEIQPHYVERARQAVSSKGVSSEIHQGNIFDFLLDKDLRWRSSGRLLVVGNPPWITNSALGTLGSENLPQKENFKGLSGFDALTGESNFDIAEYIWLKLIRELIEERPTIALLCKTSVARNVLAYARANNWPIIASSLHRINSKKWFNAAVHAALFTVELGDAPPNYECRVYPSLDSQDPESVMGFVNSRLVADLEAYKFSAVADGQCPFVWRQGIKHDAASVMELKRESNTFTNKLGELVDIEPEFVYPLLKSSDLYKTTKPASRWFMIVPQERVGQDTMRLQMEAPKLWRYLCAHEEHFNKRKSSIYKNQPPFSVFGIGSYSFAPYKVAVAGLTKTPHFWPLASMEGQPFVLDDTGYFLPCQTEEQAQILSSILNHPLCLGLLKSMTFADSKRPITKKLLQRIDVMALLELALDEPSLSEAKTILASLLAPTDLSRPT